MILQEIYKNNFEVFIPEFFLTTVFLIFLIFSVFYQNNEKKILIIKILNNIIIYLLFLTLLLILNNQTPLLVIANGTFISDQLTQFIKIILIYTTIIIFFIQQNYIIQQKILRFENTILILISLLGLMLLSSSYNLISLYLAIELQSLCFYILTASQRKSILAAEASLKYFVLGAIASSFILFGSSIIYGSLGSLNFSDIFLIISNINNINHLISVFYGLLFILIGLLFKTGAAPFHLWLPDVYEGSPNNITSFFALVPKIAYIGLFIRFFFDIFNNISYFFEPLLYFCALSSIIIGSFFSLQQKKIKRFLAYSSITHVGFILMGFLSFNSFDSIISILFYILFYIIMSINIWTFYLSFNLNNKPIKYLSDLSYIYQSNFFLFFLIILNLFSMAGIPPLVGFFSKMLIFFSLLKTKYYGLIFISILLSVLITFYYTRFIKIIYFDENKQKKKYITILPKIQSIILIIHSQIIIFFFFFPNFILTYLTKIYLYLLI